MNVLMNGQWLPAAEEETIADLLARLAIDPKRVAVERNLEIVPKGRYAETRLCEGDRLEVVHFVGGG